MSNTIRSIVTDSNSNPVDGATVAVWNQDSPQTVKTQTTNSNGIYEFSSHPDGDGTEQTWFVSVYWYEGTDMYNGYDRPFITASLD